MTIYGLQPLVISDLYFEVRNAIAHLCYNYIAINVLEILLPDRTYFFWGKSEYNIV